MWAGTLIAIALVACGASAPVEPFPPCLQPADVARLDDVLIRYLPTFSRGNPIDNADRLIADGSVTFASREPFTLPEDPDWNEDPFQDPSWVFQYQSLLFIQDALVAFQSTGEQRYLDAAELHLSRWLDDHLDPAFEADWSDYVVANRTRILLLAWELFRARDPSSAIVGETCQMLAVQADHLTRESEYAKNHNHGYFQDDALLALSLGFKEDPRSAQWSAIARDRIAGQIEYAVSPEGVHREHSPSYHAGMQQNFMVLASLLEHFGISIRVDIRAVVASMWSFAAYGALPTGDAPLVGDSSSWFGTPNDDASDEARYSLGQGRYGVVPAEVDRVFPQSGYAFFRDRWHDAPTFTDTVYVAFIAAYFSKAHKHCDDLSVLLWGRGESWLTDSGMWSYDPKDPFTELAYSPAGHNVVEVDDHSYLNDLPAQDPLQAPPLITGYELGADHSWVEGEHAFNPGATFRRRLDYTRPADLVVLDELTTRDGDRHRYTLYWHLAADKQVEALGPNRFRATNPAHPGPSLELAITGSTAMSCQVLRGTEDPYRGWLFPIFLEYVPASVIACTQHATDASFTSSIRID